MIGRFLLGSGLGALVGTGLLALASVVSPAPGTPQLPQTDEAMKAGDAPAATPEAAKTTPETAPATAEASKPADAPEPAAPSAGQTRTDMATPEAAAATAPETAEPTAPSDTAEAATPEPAPPQPEAAQPEATATAESVAPAVPESEPPPAPAVADADAAPKVPETAEAPAAPASPENPAGLNSDTSPEVAAAPAQAPEVAGTTPPDSPAPPAESTEIAAIPALLDQPEGKAAPGAPDAPVPENAPASADLPAPPPLTPEEEALLRQLAEDSPGNAGPEGTPEGALVAPEPAAPEVAETTPEESLPEPELADLPATDLPKDPEPADAPEGPGPDDMVLKPDPEGSTLPPAPGLSDEEEGVTIGRLPRIGDAEPTPSTEAAASDKPLARYARPFENPEAKPLFAIVLIDDGAADLDRQALAALPFPVSFALDPTDPNAPANAAIYRAAGQEVLMLATALPKGAAASDVEVAMAAMEQALPETVAVLDTPERSFQADRPLAGLVVPVIGAQGRGVLTWDQGLNAADQVARREDVPSAVAFRDLDGAAEAATVIRRYLDRAAFKAAQEGRVTVIGRTRPDTVAAILEWTVEGRAATVALAPVSAAMVVE